MAERTKLSVDEVIRLHSATVFHIYMLGFLPGFPYMGDLPPALHLPRRQSPRVRVPQGAVSIAMSMSCIYVLESPGGWHVLSNTPAFLWDPRRENAGLLAAGDKVQFTPISLDEYQALRGRAERGEMGPRSGACWGGGMTASFRVVSPGLLTTVQDRGRIGHQSLGVPVSGAMDLLSFEAANAIAGNPPEQRRSRSPTRARRSRSRAAACASPMWAARLRSTSSQGPARRDACRRCRASASWPAISCASAR